MMQFRIQRKVLVDILPLFIILLLPIFFSEKAEAANLQQTWVRFDRMAAATPTTGMVCAKTAVADVTESNVVVTFPTSFVLGSFSTFTVDTANLPNGATPWAGILTATNVTGQAVTFPSSNLTANTLYCFNWTSTTAVTTASAGASQTGTVASGGNSSTFSTAIVSAGLDLISVTATVPASFTFSLSGNTDTLGALSTTTASSAGKTVTIATNAAAGWVAWVKSANAGLSSVSTGASVATAGTVDNTPTDLASATGYVLDVDITTDSATGTGVVSQAANYGAEYNGTNTTSGGTLTTTFQPIAASTGTTDGDVLTLIERAKITAIQAAASDYADILTIVAAGRF